MHIKIRVQWTYNDIHNNNSRYTLYKYNKNQVLQIKMCHDSFFESIKGQ